MLLYIAKGAIQARKTFRFTPKGSYDDELYKFAKNRQPNHMKITKLLDS